MQTQVRHFLDYDPIALLVLLVGIPAILLVACNI